MDGQEQLKEIKNQLKKNIENTEALFDNLLKEIESLNKNDKQTEEILQLITHYKNKLNLNLSKNLKQEEE
jgi:hypothetical protein|tara:strand:- start:399 stop:608 length:210 start_codon:yes stop_codon:yes gene_type:complete